MSNVSDAVNDSRNTLDQDGVLDIDSLKQFTIPKKNKAKTGIGCSAMLMALLSAGLIDHCLSGEFWYWFSVIVLPYALQCLAFRVF
jgi:hypothetical protein